MRRYESWAGAVGMLMRLSIAALMVSMILTYSAALADDETATDETVADTEQSYYNNPAQAAHAAQLADAAAAKDPAVQQAWDSYKAAENTYNELENPTEADLETLKAAETAYEEALATALGLSSEKIAAMRAAGMGWGEIAHELGVHPSLLGLGHTKGKTNRHGVEKEFRGIVATDELAEATSRVTGRGLAHGHGKGLNSSLDTTETSVALASTTTKSDRGKSSVSGTGGLSSGKSNGAGNSNAGGNSASSGKGSSSSSSGSGKGNNGNSSNSSNGNKGGNSDHSNNGKGNDGNNGNGKGNDKK